MEKEFDGLAGIVEGISMGQGAVNAVESFLKKNVIEYDQHKKK